MANSTYELIIKATDQASGSLNKVNRSLSSIDKSAKRSNGILKKMGGLIAAIGVGRTIRGIIKVGSKFEDLRSTLSVVTGSLEQGADALSHLQDMATRTTFGVEALTTSYIKLKTAGVEPTDKLMMLFADTASVTTDQLGALTAMTDLFSRSVSGGLGLEDLNRLADRGIPVFKMLGDELGLTRLQISAYGKTAEGANKIQKAFIRQAEKAYGGASKKKLDNLSVAMQNFGEEMKKAAGIMTDEFGPILAQQLRDATKFLAANEEIFQSLGVNLAQGISQLGSVFGLIIDNIHAIGNAIKMGMGLLVLERFTSFLSNANKNLNNNIGIFTTSNKKTRAELAKTTAKTKELVKQQYSYGAAVKKTHKYQVKSLGKFAALGVILKNIFVHPLRTIATLSKKLAAFFMKMTWWGKALTAISVAYFALSSISSDITIRLGKDAYKLGEIYDALGEVIKTKFGNAWDYVADKTTTVFGYIGDYIKQIANDSISLGIVVAKTIGSMFMGLLKSIDGIWKTIVKFPMRLAKAFKDAWDSISFGADSKENGAKVAKAFSDNFKGTLDKEFKNISFIPDNLSADFNIDHIGDLKKTIIDTYGNVADWAEEAFANSDMAMLLKEQIDDVRALDAAMEMVVATQQEMEDIWAQNKEMADLALTSTTKKLSDVEQGYLDLINGIDDTIKTNKDNIQVMRMVNDSWNDGTLFVDQYHAAIKSLAASGVPEAIAKMEELGLGVEEVADKFKDQLSAAVTSFGDTLTDALATGAVSLNNFKDYFNQFLDDILRAIIQKNITAPLMDQIDAVIQKLAGSGGLTDALSGIFGDWSGSSGGSWFDNLVSWGSDFFKAKGGPVKGNQSYMVGEQGPELFTPNSSGRITPNHELSGGGGGGGTSNINFNINAVSTRDGIEFLLENKPTIINLVQQASHQRGKAGILD
jgi:ketosteroid isomerase-like protein